MIIKTCQFTPSVGWSDGPFPELDSSNTLILVFAAPYYLNHPEPIEYLAKIYSKAKIIGCSSAGEIAGSLLLDNSLSIAIIQFEKTTIQSVCQKLASSIDSFATGQKIATSLYQPHLKSIFVLSDGLSINGSDFVNGLNTIAHDVIITGGLAGDGTDFKRTWTIYGGKIQHNAIVGVGFYGEYIKVSHGSKGGWDIFGPERIITRSKNNILYELDGKPALAIYKDYLGDKAAGLPATGLFFPLSIRKNVEDNEQLVRTILGVDEKNQSLIFAGDMPVGYLAKLMRASLDKLIIGAYDAGELTYKQEESVRKDGHQSLLIAISCIGRRLVLSERTEEEIEATIELFPENTQQVGFYSYGELSPCATGKCNLHNQTMTLTSICELA